MLSDERRRAVGIMPFILFVMLVICIQGKLLLNRCVENEHHQLVCELFVLLVVLCIV